MFVGGSSDVATTVVTSLVVTSPPFGTAPTMNATQHLEVIASSDEPST